ncbi:MAG: hypothetical protein R3Y10_00845 [Ferrimonas sp.]
MERNTSTIPNSSAKGTKAITNTPPAKEENASWREGAVGQELVQLLEQSYPSDSDAPTQSK